MALAAVCWVEVFCDEAVAVDWSATLPPGGGGGGVATVTVVELGLLLS